MPGKMKELWFVFFLNKLKIPKGFIYACFLIEMLNILLGIYFCDLVVLDYIF